jgi:hypothetical protein
MMIVGLTVLCCFVFVTIFIPMVLAEGSGKVTFVVHRSKQPYVILDNGLDIVVGEIRQFVQAGDKIEKSKISFSYAINGRRINAFPYEAEFLFVGMLPGVFWFMILGTLFFVCSKDFRNA